ncbi:MAG: patatin-like phospholipase family protein [Candidatus Omnitrophica bacterium]|nr:patatin-like phospholipase family protein [Candidatus Omnitrophota bacterium]
MTAAHADSNHRSVNKRLILKQLPLFAGLSDAELALIAHHSRLVDVGKDELVYAQGDPPDALYVVVTGRARIFMPHPSGQEETLEIIHRGDYFGVISLLTQQPHSVSVRALNDSIFIRIRQDEFDALLRNIPSLAVHFSQTLSRRLGQRRRENAKRVFEATIVSIYSATRGMGRTQYAVNLACSIQKETGKRVVLLDMSPSGSEISSLLGAPSQPPAITLRGAVFEPARVHSSLVTYPIGISTLNIAHDPKMVSNVTQIAPLLAFLAHEFHYVIVDLPYEMDRSVFKGLTQADAIHLVSDTTPQNLQAAGELAAELKRTVQRAGERLQIVVTELGEGVPPGEQINYLRHAVGATLPHAGAAPVEGGLPIVVRDPGSSYARAVRRIAREIGDVRLGLALGSGAALGLAHIGVLRVLEKEGIYVDVVAGSSMGALIGALWCAGMTSYELEEVAKGFRGRWKTFSLFAGDIVFPVPKYGFITGERVMKLLGRYLEGKTFHDLKTPIKITACDYMRRELVICETGSVLDAVRASISIPAIFVPHPIGGRQMIDGGILDPVPVDVLVKMGVHKIIAVNTLPSPLDIQKKWEEAAQEEAARTAQLKGAWAKWRFAFNRKLLDFFSPKIADIIMHSMQAMEFILAEHGCAQADVALHPTIPRINWYEFYNVDDLIRQGEEETRKFLPQIEQLVRL